jgi:hypothetical protein
MPSAHTSQPRPHAPSVGDSQSSSTKRRSWPQDRGRCGAASQVQLLDVGRRRLEADLELVVRAEAVGVLAVATVAGAAAELRERRVPRLGSEHAQERRRVERAGADLDVDGLLDHAAVIGPEPLELEDQVL